MEIITHSASEGVHFNTARNPIQWSQFTIHYDLCLSWINQFVPRALNHKPYAVKFCCFSVKMQMAGSSFALFIFIISQ
jgi:hypothetical protein